MVETGGHENKNMLEIVVVMVGLVTVCVLLVALPEDVDVLAGIMDTIGEVTIVACMGFIILEIVKSLKNKVG